MHSSARLLAALALTVAMGMIPASAVAQPSFNPHHGEGGVIVWTHRAAKGSEHLMIADADGGHPCVVLHVLRAVSGARDSRPLLFDRQHFLMRSISDASGSPDVAVGSIFVALRS